MNINTVLLLLSGVMADVTSAMAQLSCDAPEAGNPFIPGYYADPTLKKFGDTYYLYATTDGSGAGFGPAQCWTSQDLRHWTLRPMNWPTSHWIWAPDVMQHTDGHYYMVYCQPCNLYIGQADTPLGPWHNLLGENRTVNLGNSGPQAQALGREYDNEGAPIWVYDRYVPGAITLDGQTFVDDDGSVYVYWGTWGIYEGFGCGVGRASTDLRTFTECRLIPNTEAKDFFEAPFVFKRQGIYYLMYSSESCHNETYHVQYATSRSPMGPYEYRGSLLETNADGTVHGPGHHSVLVEGDQYYIVYHRHDNPHSNRGFHRQICIDRMEFDAEGNILPIQPTHAGSFPQRPSSVKGHNLALQASVKASSYYDDDFRPEYAVDDNNGTLWRPRTDHEEWLQIDLGKVQPVQTVWTQWEYGTQYYQYRIETSLDGNQWQLFADRSHNLSAGSPKVDLSPAIDRKGRLKPQRARYLRITFLKAQKVGYPGALWNVKVFSTREDALSYEWPDHHEPGTDGLPIINLTADDFLPADTLWYWQNHGTLGGGFELQPTQPGEDFAPRVAAEVLGRRAIPFDSLCHLVSDFPLPACFRDNVPYRLEATLLNPTIELNECVADFTSSHDELEKLMLVNGTEPRCGIMNHYGWYEDAGYPADTVHHRPGISALAGEWQHYVAEFDGRIERIWINGDLVSEKDLQLMIKPSQRVTLGLNAEHEWPFTGYLHSLRLTLK